MCELLKQHEELYREKLGIHEGTSLIFSKSLTERYRFLLLEKNNILSLDYTESDFVSEFNPMRYDYLFTKTTVDFDNFESAKKFSTKFKNKIKNVVVPILPGISKEYIQPNIRSTLSENLFYNEYIYSISVNTNLLLKNGKMSEFKEHIYRYGSDVVRVRQKKSINRWNNEVKTISIVLNLNDPDIITELLLYYPEYIKISKRLIYSDVITNSKIRL